MKLSIITINYNDALGLKKTIESVVHQTFLDYEYIVIDGGSTDNSVDVIKQYEDKITYWVSEPDKGIYNAMNKGILKANGEYLQFLNSGDWYCNNFVLENIFQDILECDLIYGNMIRIDSNENIYIDKGNKGEKITLNTLFTGTINHSSSFINRNVFKLHGLYDESLKIVSDWKFFLVAFGLNNSNITYKDIDVNYFDQGGISSSNWDLGRKEREFVLNKLVSDPILQDYNDFGNYGIIINHIKSHYLTTKLLGILLSFLSKVTTLLNRLK